MDGAVLTAIISVTAAISSILLGWHGKTKSFKDEEAREATADASLHRRCSYIKRGIDDIKVDVLKDSEWTG